MTQGSIWQRLGWTLVIGLVCGMPLTGFGQTEPPASESEPPLPTRLILDPGEIRSMSVKELKRVAVGDPAVVDVRIVSADEVLLQAKSPGSTNLILWDEEGQHLSTVEVINHALEVREAQLTQLLRELKLPGVMIKPGNGQLFLTGAVFSQEEVARLNQILEAFPDVSNLVNVPPPSEVRPEDSLVKLAVQVIDINRKDLEQLGVNWSQSTTLSEKALTDLSVRAALFRLGDNVSRTGLSATINALVQQNRARILAEPKLVTVSGKEASSFVGVEVPVIEATSFGLGASSGTAQASITFRQTGMLLKMTPEVLKDRKISLVIETELSAVDEGSGVNIPVGNQTAKVPGFSVRKTSTQVMTSSGQTVIVAGLLQVEDSKTVSQVPALGGIPVFGRLFRSPQSTIIEREIVVTVTPELLEQADATTRAAQPGPTPLSAPTPASPEESSRRYALQVQDRIAKALRYPTYEETPGRGGQVKLRLHLHRDGTLDRVLVAESSGIDSFDQAAVQAAKRQSPYPMFPPEVIQQDLWLDLPIFFRP